MARRHQPRAAGTTTTDHARQLFLIVGGARKEGLRLGAVLALMFCCCWLSTVYYYYYFYDTTTTTLRKGSKGVGNETTTATSNSSAHVIDEDTNTASGSADDGTGATTTITTKPHRTTPILLWPNLALDRYKERHSQQALLIEYGTAAEEEETANGGRNNRAYDRGRRFAVAYYWCPERAGNILHNLFNSVLWGIITNRTVLWRYDPYYRENRIEDCDRILTRATWIPTWDEWSSKLKLEDDDVVPIPIDINRRTYDERHRVVAFPQIEDIEFGNVNSRLYRGVSWRDHPLSSLQYKLYIDGMPAERKTAAGMLYYEGTNYVFGMLFRECFTFDVERLPAMDASAFVDDERQLNKEDGALSIALHSRHPVVGDDGTYLNDEKHCLAELVAEYRSNNNKYLTIDRSNCRIHLMSDRTRSIEILSRWVVEEYNCTPMAASYHLSPRNVPLQAANYSTRMKKVTEHGPNPGVGFLTELALASRARWGVIGDVHRSSTMLLVELIEYDRTIEAWRAFDNSNNANSEEEFDATAVLDDLRLCSLPDKPSAGYSYGKGTPTFRHHSLQEPLDPVRIMQQYKQHHSVNAVLEHHEGDQRRYVRVSYPCIGENVRGEDAATAVHQFLNGKTAAHCSLLNLSHSAFLTILILIYTCQAF